LATGEINELAPNNSIRRAGGELLLVKRGEGAEGGEPPFREERGEWGGYQLFTGDGGFVRKQA